MDVGEKDPLVFRDVATLFSSVFCLRVSLSSLRSAGKYQKEPPTRDRASRVKEREREIAVVYVVSLFLHRRQKKAYYTHVLGAQAFSSFPLVTKKRQSDF